MAKNNNDNNRNALTQNLNEFPFSEERKLGC